VARNVAHDLAELGLGVELVAAVGDDVFGDRIIDEAAGAGVGVAHILHTVSPTGTYTAVLDDQGELVVAVSDFAGSGELTPAVIDERASLLRHAAWIVADANLPVAALERVLSIAATAKVRVPVAMDPVSVPKAGRVADLLRRHHPVALLTPNREELEVLVGRAVGAADLEGAASQLHEEGVGVVWVRLGVGGSYLSVAGGPSPHFDVIPGPVIDVTGAGDAALAGWLWATLGGRDPIAAARYGHAAAAIVIATEGAVSAGLSSGALEALVARHLPEVLP
jgi:pseudouridine kinase